MMQYRDHLMWSLFKMTCLTKGKGGKLCYSQILPGIHGVEGIQGWGSWKGEVGVIREGGSRGVYVCERGSGVWVGANSGVSE